MILFLLVCAVFVGIALMFVLPPLLQPAEKAENEGDGSRKEANVAVYRDQLAELARDLDNGLITPDQHQQDRSELERRLLEDVSTGGDDAKEPVKYVAADRAHVYALAFAIPILALALYWRVGNPNALSTAPTDPSQVTAPQEPRSNREPSQEQIEANVAALAKRLEQSPDDLQGWIMLGRSYSSLGRYSDSSTAYKKATELKTDDADLLAEYAFSLAMANGQRLQGQPSELVNKALKLDPENPKALELAGSVAFQEKDYKRAIGHWQKLLQKIPPNSEVSQALERRIEEAKSLAGDGK